MTARVSIGAVEVVALSDAERPYDAHKVYPEVASEALSAYGEHLQDDGAILLNFGCYLIRAEGRTVLVDTGWGPGFHGRLLDELAAVGVDIDEVDMVVLTHLHGDHIGWNVVHGDDGPRPRFSRARYLVPEADWRHYRAQPQPSDLFREQVVSLESLGVMDLIGGDHVLTHSVTTVATPGHTPGHLSVAITSGGEHGFILGDVAISPIEAQETAWVNSFDGDRALAQQTRHAVLDRLERDQSIVGASHFPRPGLGRFVRVDGRRRWQPL